MARSRKWVTNGQLRWWYRRLNRAYWGGRLPTPGQILFRRKMRGEGHTVFLNLGREQIVAEVALSHRMQRIPSLCGIALLHEMAHVAKPRAGEGPEHKREIARLFRAGAYHGLL
jgi:hypothetical protein